MEDSEEEISSNSVSESSQSSLNDTSIPDFNVQKRRFSRERTTFKTTISLDAQRAIWALVFIDKIRSASEHKNNYQDRLRTQLIDLQLPPKIYDRFHFSQDLESQMKKIFTTGSAIDMQFFCEERIAQSFNKNQKFTFLPNYSVTQPIFNKLMIPGKYLLLTGQKGAGKTISIAIAIYFYNFVYKYVFEANKTQNIILSKQFKEVQKLIQMPNVKYWYWSINMTECLKEEFSLNNVILSQAVQLSQLQKSELMKLSSFNEFKDKLLSFYPRYTHHNFVIDHIDCLASLATDWNSFLKDKMDTLIQYEQKNTSESELKEVQLMIKKNKQQSLEPLIKLGSFLSKIRKFAFRVIFVSSSNLQREYFNLQKPLVLGLDCLKPISVIDHQIDIYDISFFQLKAKTRKYDFWQFFWFQISRQMKFDSNQFEKAKIWFINQVNQLKFKKSYSLLQASQFIKIQIEFSQKFRELIISGSEVNNLWLTSTMEKFDKQSAKQSRSRVRQFLNRGDIISKEMKKNILKELLKTAHAIKKTSQQRFEFPYNQFKQLIKLLLKLECAQSLISSNQLTSLLGKDSLTLVYRRVHRYRHSNSFPLVEKGFITIGNICHQDEQKISWNKVINNSNIFAYVKEYCFLASICLQGKIRHKVKKTKIIIKIQNYNIEGCWFSIIQKSHNFQDSFKLIIEQCIKLPGKWILGIPGQEKEYDDPLEICNYDDSNRVFDFMTVKFSRYTQKFEMKTFDVTAAEKYINQKQRESIKFYQSFSSQQIHRFLITHIIIFPPMHMVGSKITENNVKIAYGSLDQLVISNHFKINQVKYFQQILDELKSVRKNVRNKQSGPSKSSKEKRKAVSKQSGSRKSSKEKRKAVSK